VLELRHLRYFVAVAEELSFSRAAKRLFMAQPPLSVAIRQLEQEIGTVLFVRTSRDVKLTDAGAAFLEGARRTLLEANAAVAAATRAASGEDGTLRIGYSWPAVFETLPALTAAFAVARPEADLLALEACNTDMAHALLSDELDIALAVCAESDSELSYAPVRSERVVAILAASHPLAAEETLRLEQLKDSRFLFALRKMAPRMTAFELALCRACGFEPEYYMASLRSCMALRRWDDRDVALGPKSVGAHLPDIVRAVPLTETAQFETSVVWRSMDSRPIISAFVEASTRVFAAEGALPAG